MEYILFLIKSLVFDDQQNNFFSLFLFNKEPNTSLNFYKIIKKIIIK